MTNWESSTSMMLILPLKSKGPLNAPYRALLRGNAGRKLGRNSHGEETGPKDHQDERCHFGLEKATPLQGQSGRGFLL